MNSDERFDWYEAHSIVVEDLEDHNWHTLLTCRICHGVVRYGHAEQHHAWHVQSGC